MTSQGAQHPRVVGWSWFSDKGEMRVDFIKLTGLFCHFSFFGINNLQFYNLQNSNITESALHASVCVSLTPYVVHHTDMFTLWTGLQTT